MNGYIALYKKILEWEWYSDVNTCRVFIHILLRANWEEKKWRGMVVKRGQWVTSLQTICNETSLSKREVRTTLERLVKSGEIDKQTTRRNTVITVLNYDLYQVCDTLNDTITTLERQPKRQQLNNIINNNLKICPPEPDARAKELEEKLWHNYEILYKAYPRKGKKQNGYTHYRGYVGKGRVINGKRWKLTNEQMFKAIKKYAAEKEGVEEKYIAEISTFLNKTIIDYVEEPNDTS